jgi:SAM-dependent methyltransferase
VDAPDAYERFLVPHLFRPWAEEVLLLAGDLEGRAILDVATGTGVAARLAAAAAGPRGLVAGLDIDHGMLRVGARSAAPQAGAAAPVGWVRASALAMPFPEGSFDAAFCLEGLQFFPDLVAGLEEIRRVLVPGGRLLASCWAALADNPGYHAISEGLRAFCSDAAARLPPVALADPDKIIRAARAAGFSAVAVERRMLMLTVPSATDLVDWIAAGGPTMRHSIAQLAEDKRGDFYRFVEQWLAPFAIAGGGGVRLPSTRHVLLAVQ